MKKKLFFVVIISFVLEFSGLANAQPAAPFIGHWKGQWEGDRGDKGPVAELGVEEKTLSYRCDPWPSWKLRGVDFKNIPYQIKGDILSFQSPTSGKDFLFKFLDDGSLEGHRSDNPASRLILKK